MAIEIRAYEASDLHTLSAIWFDASLLAHAFLGEARLREQRALIEAVYLPKAETWVACRAGEPVGFIGLLDGSIGGLFVAPAMHGHGIGRALVEHALALKGALDLEVYADNLGARAFYARLGFDEISRRDEDDEGLPFANILMRSTR
ncbi:GNAT family N-acetyltransferase [Burkholderia contaminans]|uniref:GNAT family N-acetyltransferase n=3 Tax=Burkholderia contaminans TaxID=488447 RepID=A0AAP4R2R5_9BURK|nr:MULTISPECIES: GNAT family N-acetyltransferase [Burkholderia]MBD1416027.1 GNAT family N-acetyltransferase [Burkholderia contaminans]MBH9670960.1 GNAT family N-acetyltransferase [Burkholderia contaminans]MBH9678106.1 GNAT family N-acetyltransferase [Burkholderia contaminans]MBH9708530.1 GNAT family N-acetyltransferase [Burkholderia contaminans]MBH9722245.1 GNAT family N-acetyltransferase [Burkholderia contaminans]